MLLYAMPICSPNTSLFPCAGREALFRTAANPLWQCAQYESTSSSERAICNSASNEQMQFTMQDVQCLAVAGRSR